MILLQHNDTSFAPVAPLQMLFYIHSFIHSFIQFNTRLSSVKGRAGSCTTGGGIEMPQRFSEISR